MTQWGKIKCSLNFHDWGKWKDKAFEYVDKETGKNIFRGTEQTRYCKLCNKEVQS